jgi:hypothetical protein
MKSVLNRGTGNVAVTDEASNFRFPTNFRKEDALDSHSILILEL